MDRTMRMTRSSISQFQTRADDEGKYISGYFAVFGSNYEIWEGDVYKRQIEHLIGWYTNRNEVVLDPFGGVMSVPYVAVKNGRKAIGIELKESYYLTGMKYMKELTMKMNQPTLFDMEEL